MNQNDQIPVLHLGPKITGTNGLNGLNGLNCLKIGVDIGKVLSASDSNPQLINVNNALESLEELQKTCKLYIISYSKGKRSANRYNKLVSNGHLNLFEDTYFVSEREYKKDVTNFLECNVMIDDKESILDDIKRSNPNIVTILYQEFNTQIKTNHKHHICVSSWKELMEKIASIQVQTYHIENKEPLESKYEITHLDSKCKLF